MTRESALGLDVAGQTINNHFDKIARLYEQGAGMERIGQYVKGWWQWVNAGVDVIVQRVEELWKRKWDGLHGGIKFYMTSRNGGDNSEAEAARAITGVNPRRSETTRREFVNYNMNVPHIPPNKEEPQLTPDFYPGSGSA